MYTFFKSFAIKSAAVVTTLAMTFVGVGLSLGSAVVAHAAPAPVTVTINKYIDGAQATATSANSVDFPMLASGTVSGTAFGPSPYALSASGYNGNTTPYQAMTSGLVVGDNYATNEDTTGAIVGATCGVDPFALVGYTSGTTLAAAQAATPTTTAPSFTNLTGDEFVIVWNQTCTTGVTTNAASVITTSDATLNGTNGNAASTDASFWVSTSTFSTASSAALPSGVYSTASLGAIASNAKFSAALSSVNGLPTVTAGTTYYFAAWTQVDGTWSPGAIKHFTTTSAVTGVTTNAATAITKSDATLNGTNGSTASTNSSFWVSTSTFSTAIPSLPAGVYSTPSLGAIASDATFSAALSSVSGLPAITAGTTYYFAAWTEVNGTWSPGTIKHFTTASAVVPGAPIISSLSPATGTIAGGDTVTITGTGFTGATAVNFGSLPATSFSVISDTSMTATSPAKTSPGKVNVTITTPIAVSAIAAADRFSYTTSAGSISGSVGDGALAVTSITPVKTNAIADGTYADGWSYLFDITVPSNEPNLSMSFANWLNSAASSTIPVAGNMEISSAQAVSTSPVVLSAANTYSSPPLDITGDLSSGLPGMQVQVLVQVAVPTGTVDGAYTTNYAVQTLP